MINIYLVNDDCLVWDINDILEIRIKFRLIGSLMGSVENLRNLPSINSIPLLLSKFEVRLGLEKQWFQIINEPLEYPKITPDKLQQFNESRKLYYDNLMNIYKEQRLKKEKEFRKDIIDINSSSSSNSNSSNSVDKNIYTNYDINIYSSTKEAIEIEPITKSLWRDERELGNKIIELNEWVNKYFSDNHGKEGEEKEEIEYQIFKDLWSRGYYISGGSKFGGNFLVYKGEPFLYHATFIVVIKKYNQTFQSLDIITTSRLAVQVNKTTLLASINSQTKKPNYIAINWKGVT